MKVSRRSFLKKALACGCGAAATGLYPGLLNTRALAATGNGTKVLFLNMNGGWDGLAIVQPSSGNVLTTLQGMRPTLVRDPATLLSISSEFGLHPHLTTLKSIHDEGKLCTILNVGYDNMSRSHADAEVAYARGVANRLSATSSGFITRLGSEYDWSPLQGVSVTGSDRAFEGGTYRGTQVSSLSSYTFTSDGTQSVHEGTYRKDLMYAVSADSAPLPGNQTEAKENLSLVVNTVDTVRAAVQGTTYPQAYPNTGYGRRFRDVDTLFSSNTITTEIGYVRFSGFDTHSAQDASFNSMLPSFNAALGVFINNMKTRGLWNNLIICVFSEFGRTNRENGSLGTDHGGAIPLLLLGGAVQGGVVGQIVPTDLTSLGWLPKRYDVVDVYRQIVQKMNYDPNRIFTNGTGLSLPSLFT